MSEKLLDKDNDTVDSFLLNCSTLSWDEQQIIEFIRNNPEEKDSIIELLKK